MELILKFLAGPTTPMANECVSEREINAIRTKTKNEIRKIAIWEPIDRLTEVVRTGNHFVRRLKIDLFNVQFCERQVLLFFSLAQIRIRDVRTTSV